MQKCVSMDFRLRLDEALLRPWQSTADTLNRIEGEHGLEFLEHGVEVRPMVGRTDFWKHADDDSEEP